MAINKITAPLATGPGVFAQPVLDQLQALAVNINNEDKVYKGVIKTGAMFNIGGAMYRADSDTTITGTYSSSTQGIKFTLSGDSAIPSYSDLSDVTYNYDKQGYYDTSGNYYYIGAQKKTTSDVSIYTGSTSYILVGTLTTRETGLFVVASYVSVTPSGSTTASCKLVKDGTVIKEGTAVLTSFTDSLSVSKRVFLGKGDTVDVYIQSPNGVTLVGKATQSLGNI